MILLTDEDNPYNDPYHDRESCGDVMCRIELAKQGAFDEGARAQLKRVMEWFSPYVLERPNTGKVRIILDYEDWQALKKEVSI